jgi:hypothetical protein
MVDIEISSFWGNGLGTAVRDFPSVSSQEKKILSYTDPDLVAE